MPKTTTDEAIVLRVYNVGETDRFCVLLMRDHGRMTARAAGVRRTKSRRGHGLLPLHRITVVWDERSFGNSISSVHCLDAHDAVWRDPYAFSCAGQGIELLLKLTEDGVPMRDVYDLTADFLRTCSGKHTSVLASLYMVKLLKLLGYLPASPSLSSRSSLALRELLDTSDDVHLSSSHQFSSPLKIELSGFLSSLLGSQLGVSLKAVPVSLAISSGVTPNCQ